MGVLNDNQFADSGWEPVNFPKPTPRRERMRRDARVAQHAQDLREEGYTGGHRSERLGFYGSSKVATAGESERRLRIGDFEQDWHRYEQSERYRDL